MFHIAFFSEEDDDIVEHIENVQEQLLPELYGGLDQQQRTS